MIDEALKALAGQMVPGGAITPGMGASGPPPMEPPPRNDLTLTRILSLLPLIAAGMKGGLPAMGGYAQGWSQGTAADLNRQDALEQDQWQRQRYAEEQARRAEQERYERTLEAGNQARLGRQEARQRVADLRNEAGDIEAGATFNNTVDVGVGGAGGGLGAAGIPIPGVSVTTPESRSRADIERIGRAMGASPSEIDRIASGTAGRLKTRKQMAAGRVLDSFGKDVDVQALRHSGQKISALDGRYTIEELEGMAGRPSGMPYKPTDEDYAAYAKQIGKQEWELTFEDRRAADRLIASAKWRPSTIAMGGTTWDEVTPLTPAAREMVNRDIRMGNPASNYTRRSPGQQNALNELLNEAAATSGPNFNPGAARVLTSVDKAALQKMRTNLDANRSMSMRTVNSIQMARDQVLAFPSGSIPVLNRFSNWTKNRLAGDPGVTKLELAVYNATQDYVRVTTGAAQSVGQTAVSSAQRAEELLNSAQTREQLMAALDWMQNDMETSLDKAEEYLQRRQLAFEERGAAVGGETGAAPIDYSAPFWQTPAGKKLLERQRQQAPR